MKLRNWAKASAALVAGAGIALAIPALPAVGQQSLPQPAIHLKSPAHIADRGAVAFVTVHFVCPIGNNAYVSVQLTERSGNGIAQGYSQQPPNIPLCQGYPQSLTLPITTSQKPFVVGTAFGEAQLQSCTNYFCTSTSSDKSIALVKS